MNGCERESVCGCTVVVVWPCVLCRLLTYSLTTLPPLLASQPPSPGPHFNFLLSHPPPPHNSCPHHHNNNHNFHWRPLLVHTVDYRYYSSSIVCRFLPSLLPWPSVLIALTHEYPHEPRSSIIHPSLASLPVSVRD